MNIKRKRKTELFCLLLIVAILLSACGNKQAELVSGITDAEVKPTPEATVMKLVETIAPTENPTSTPDAVSAESTTPAPEVMSTEISTEISKTDGLSDEQRNSIGMLNFLTMLTQEINASRNSRLFLEEAYSSLVNNTYPNAVDQETEFRLDEILEELKNYRLNAVKRERLQFIYERNKAQAIRAAVPNPLGLLSSVRSFNWPQLIASVAYMAVDSITSYQNASSQAELQYLQDGWELDDKEYETLHKLRSRAFTYMIEMVNSNNLPGDLALNEKSVEYFVSWKTEENVVRRIQLLEANRNVYEGFGPYWLTLADSYYTNKKYQECIDAVTEYENLSTRIFRQDFDLAKTLPAALLSAMEVLDGEEYNKTAAHYLSLIEANAAFDDWALRYFAAQGYIDLYQRTNDSAYLWKAYDLVLNSVTLMVSEQRELNAGYLADVQKINTPADASEAKKKEIEQLNKQAEEERKTAIIPISEPMVLNCDLLFSIADILGISPEAQVKIESIIHHNGQPLFLVPAIDNRYWFVKKAALSAAEMEANYENGTFTLPIQCITDTSIIRLNVVSGAKSTEISDWTLNSVTRKEKDNLAQFKAVFRSATAADKYQFKAGDQLVFTIIPTGNEQDGKYEFIFVAEERTDWIFHHFLVYTRTGMN